MEKAMASDVYLQIEGIDGESTDESHRKWIELITAAWGGSQPQGGPASTAGGHTSGRVDFNEISCSKIVDLASPKLLEAMACGRTLPKAKLEFMRADGGKPIKYYEIELTNVMISECHQSHTGSGLVMDTFGLRFGTVKWKYTKQQLGGGAGGNTAGGWDLANNRLPT